MIRILFVGEGPGDIGREGAPEVAYRGDLVEITERILRAWASNPKAIRFKAVLATWNEPGTKTRGARRRQDGQPRGFAAKLTRILSKRGSEVDAVIAVVDASGEGRSRLKQLQDGRQDAEREGLAIAYRCALGVAVQEIEAWLLADDDARRYGFGESVGRRSLMAQPEEIDDPRSHFNELAGQCLSDKLLIRSAIVNNMRIDEVAKRCPEGFSPFKREVEGCIGRCFQPDTL